MKLSLNYDNYRNPVTRGGGWIGYSSHARAACRFDLHPGYRDIVGFRVCRSVR
jgi:formylglycine-generating enzyme required for sulfatase activity